MALSRGNSLNRPTVFAQLSAKITWIARVYWLMMFALSGFLAASLSGYSPGDAGWSFSIQSARVSNPMGAPGAWIADCLLYWFGFSAWWWVVLPLVLFRRFYRRAAGWSVFSAAFAGFSGVLIASGGLEALRFYSHRLPLPLFPGGAIGGEASRFAVRGVGYTGATLLFLLALAIAWSAFSGMSWNRVSERVGMLLERLYLAVRMRVERWQDNRIGHETARQREAIVKDEKRRMEETHQPVIVERTEPARASSPKVEKRVERERQPALFPEAIVGGLLPHLRLLEPVSVGDSEISLESIEYTSRLIEKKLADFGVQVKVLTAYPGPVITRYEIEPSVGVKGSKIVNLATDIARSLSVTSIRVVEIIPGKSCMALELPNPRRQIVRLSELVSSAAYNDALSSLTITLGKDIGGQPVVADLAKMPHLLVAGTTGSGKSVGINAMILSLLYKSEPRDVRLILIDPKMLELSVYEDIPHLLAPVVVDMKQAANALAWCIGEMEQRYKLMSALRVRSITGFNARVIECEKNGEPLANPLSLTPDSPEPLSVMPNIVVVIDELADLMMIAGKKVEQLIARLAQKARASGIHLILATQRPSVDVITGLIKANIPTRIAFQVSSKIDSRTILDQMGAETLLGQGDMLYLPSGAGYPTRVHGAFVADEEVHRVVDYLKRSGKPNYVDGILAGGALGDDAEMNDGEESASNAESDPLYDQAVEIVVKNRRASISYVQRRLNVGYNRAANLIEAMEQAGIVSAMDNRGGREVLIPEEAQ